MCVCVCVCVCVCLCVWTVPFILVVPCSDSSNQQIILLLLLIEAFYFLRIQAHTHTCTLTNGLRREREMDTYIQLDQQINYSEQCDSRCLGGRDSAVVSATTFDQKFKNRPCVANRRLDESLRPGFPSSPTPATIFSSQIFWGHWLRGDTFVERLQTTATCCYLLHHGYEQLWIISGRKKDIARLALNYKAG